ncbi:hypothetical protein ACWEV3_15735 [Saccharopolyspora sp. NPDC003752]
MTTTVPFGSFAETDDGASVVKWDQNKAETEESDHSHPDPARVLVIRIVLVLL